MIDAVDLRLLAALQENGRLTIVDLSQRAVLTAPPCLRRLQKLEETGFIRGYHAELDAEKLGYAVGAIIAVGLVSQARADIEKFEALVLGWPLVRECHALNGEIDFLLHCVARSWEQLNAFVTNTLLATQNVKTVRTSTVIRAVKNEPGVPVETLIAQNGRRPGS